jgi:epoxide hydrolase
MSLSALPHPIKAKGEGPVDAITPFTLAVPQADLEDLNHRIDQTRWPDAETVDDWTQGTPLAKVKALLDH